MSISVGSYVSYNTWNRAFCLLKLIFHLIPTQNIMKIKKKTGLHFFKDREIVQNGEIQDGRQRI